MNFCKRVIAVVAVCLIMLSSVLPTTIYTSANSTISSEVQEHILNELRRANIPNAAISVVQGDEVSYIFKDWL